MAKALGLGGVFFKARDLAAFTAWYRDVLGLEMADWGDAVLRSEPIAAHPGAATVFSRFKADTAYFAPSTKDFMINFAVDDLDGVLARCAEHGVTPIKTMPDEGMGKFAHIMDPEGNKLELWEPKPMG